MLEGLEVSTRTARTIRSYAQSFSRFGFTIHQKVHFSTFYARLEIQCHQNPSVRSGSPQYTFINLKTKLWNRKVQVFQISFSFFPVSLTSAQVKSDIEGRTNMPVDCLTHLTLWRAGAQVTGRLEDGRPLSCYNIKQGDTIKIRITNDQMEWCRWWRVAWDLSSLSVVVNLECFSDRSRHLKPLAIRLLCV